MSMRPRTGHVFVTACSAAILTATPACSWFTPFDVAGDAGTDGGGDASAPIDGDTDSGDSAIADADADVEAGPGPLVLVAARMSVVPERVCDVDGDGSLDNAVADLGSERAAVFASIFDVALGRAYDEGKRAMVHFHLVDDLSVPEAAAATLVGYAGQDMDDPLVPSDDLSGEEPFWVGADYLGPCGEPLYLVEGVRIHDGMISGDRGTLLHSFAGDLVRFEISQLTGVLAPGGESFSLTYCGHIRIQDLGGATESFGDDSDLSLLEGLLSGGDPLGVEVDGIEPNVDLDGDGIEQLVLDPEFHIARCVDGDRTVIEGRDCWQDSRIADGFALTFRLEGARARYGGREPAWEYRVEGPCADGPPEDGFFSTIPPEAGTGAGLDEPCNPLMLHPCSDSTHRCSGGDGHGYRCYAPCAPAPCAFGDRLGSCEDPLGTESPICWALGVRPAESDCTPGERGCTSEYGVSTETVCIDHLTRIHCVESCAQVVESCGDNRRCVPLRFAPGGVCAYP